MDIFTIAILTFLGVIAFILLLAWLLPPIVIKKAPENGVNATNGFFLIHINPELRYFDAVLAQELYECRLKKVPWQGLKIVFSKRAQQYMEIMGHEIEVQHAVGGGSQQEINHYRYQEAHALTGYRQFSGVHFSTIQQAMESATPLAKKWLLKRFPGRIWYL